MIKNKTKTMRKLSLSSISLLAVAVIINAFKKEIFALKPGYAPHELQFALAFIFPVILICLILSSIVLVKWLRLPKNINGWSVLYLFLAAPGFILGVFSIIVSLFILLG